MLQIPPMIPQMVYEIPQMEFCHFIHHLQQTH